MFQSFYNHPTHDYFRDYSIMKIEDIFTSDKF